MSVRVLIADDQELVRTGLRMILDAQPDIEVVGEASDGAEAIALAHSIRPDVCLIDIRMPKINGAELCRLLRPHYDPSTKFVALTAHVLPEEREQLLMNGFDIVLGKPFHESELLRALGIPAEVQAGQYTSVTIWCKRFAVSFGAAQLVPA